MYKILHLFRDEKFTENYIKFVNENFKKDYHEIWVFGRRISHVKTNMFCCKNVKRVVDIDKKLKARQMDKFDKIIYHGVFEYNIVDFFSKNKKLLAKLYLYFWGGDKFYVHDKKYNLKKKYVIKNARGIINILPEEKRYIQKYYRSKGHFFCAKYSDDFEFYQNIKKQKSKEQDYIAIQVGNSATKTNNHIHILQQLSKYKDENIRIYVPLSYGDSVYAEKVKKKGMELFGEKFFALTEFISFDKYIQFLKSIDIAIFDMNRQQAQGNIIVLLYFGKKVFLRNKSVLLHYFRLKKKCDVYTTEEISGMEYDRFISFSNTSKIENGNRVEDLLKLESRIVEWSKIFND